MAQTVEDLKSTALHGTETPMMMIIPVSGALTTGSLDPVPDTGGPLFLFFYSLIDRHLTAISPLLSNDAVEYGACLARNSLFNLVLKTSKLY